MATTKKSKSAKASAKKSPKKKKKLTLKQKMAIAYPPFEYAHLKPAPIIGVDEVGRGCLAGRVYAAAVILPSGYINDSITDSKLISEERRNEISEDIKKVAQVCVAFAEVEEIDSINILKASLLAMKRAVEGLGIKSGTVLIDGNQKIPKLSRKFKQVTIVKGDLRAKPIGAASIVAKVARDQEMIRLAQTYPQYGFEKHKGYASESHRKAIQEFGPSVIHRRTFCSVKEFMEGNLAVIEANISEAVNTLTSDGLKVGT